MTTLDPHRPDRRDPAVVWHWFLLAFEQQAFPNVSFALGSDWGMGLGRPTAESYRKAAFERMERLYGAQPVEV